MRSSPVSLPRDENESDGDGCELIAMVIGALGHSRSSTISRSAVVGMANALRLSLIHISEPTRPY